MRTEHIKPYTIQEENNEMKNKIKEYKKKIDDIIYKFWNRFISQNEIRQIRYILEDMSNDMLLLFNNQIKWVGNYQIE